MSLGDAVGAGYVDFWHQLQDRRLETRNMWQDLQALMRSLLLKRRSFGLVVELLRWGKVGVPPDAAQLIVQFLLSNLVTVDMPTVLHSPLRSSSRLSPFLTWKLLDIEFVDVIRFRINLRDRLSAAKQLEERLDAKLEHFAGVLQQPSWAVRSLILTISAVELDISDDCSSCPRGVSSETVPRSLFDWDRAFSRIY